MAYGHGKDAYMTITRWTSNDFNLTPYLTSIDFGDFEADVAEVSTMGDSYREYIAGLKNTEFQVEGIYDISAGTLIAAIVGGTAAPFVYAPQGTASGSTKISGSAICTAFSAPASIDEAVTFGASFQVSGSVTFATY